METKIIAPWYVFHKKVKALFNGDPDIEVGDMLTPEESRDEFYRFPISVKKHDKFEALYREFPPVKIFGNVVLKIDIYDLENLEAQAAKDVDTYETIFRGNTIVADFLRLHDFAGEEHGFVEFQPTVVQFLADNTSDPYGLITCLPQDIASEIFAKAFNGVHFCTAPLPEMTKDVVLDTSSETEE